MHCLRGQRRHTHLPVLFVLIALSLLGVVCGGSEAGDSDEASPTPGAATATPFRLPERSPTSMELPIRIAVTLPLFEYFAVAGGLDNVEVISLIPQGADPHSYEFTPDDIERMKGVDFFFLNSLGLDSRLKDVIEANRDETAYVVPFAPNILSPGNPSITAEQAGDNPHLWLDPSLASVYVEIVVDELDIYDGINSQYYDTNFAEFKQWMVQLQDEIYALLLQVPDSPRRLVTHHDSFKHFAREFDMKEPAFAVTAPGDAPRDAVARLSRLVREEGIPAVFAEYGYDRTVMDQVGAQAGVPVCTLYSDIVNPALTFEEMMRANADEIVRCLG